MEEGGLEMNECVRGIEDGGGRVAACEGVGEAEIYLILFLQDNSLAV